jgi:Zn-dependent protease
MASAKPGKRQKPKNNKTNQKKTKRRKRWPRRTRLRVGRLEFCDPLPACMVLYFLLYFDAGGFMRIGMLAACLHECGHILACRRLTRQWPRIEVTMTGFCMKTRGLLLPARQAFALAAAGPAVNVLLAAVWWARLRRHVTLWDDAFFAANVLTAAFNLLPVPPLDGAQLWAQGRAMRREMRAETGKTE